MTNVPELKWVKNNFSQQMIADYKPFTMVDGEGVRCALYVSGCMFKCDGCFNKAAQSFRYGKKYSSVLEETILRDLSHSGVQGLSLLGGEPFLNTDVCLSVVERMKTNFPSKDLWIWTGFTLEWLLKNGNSEQLKLLQYVDVLIDGEFCLELKDLTLPFRGSSNQRVINVQESLKKKETIDYFS